MTAKTECQDFWRDKLSDPKE